MGTNKKTEKAVGQNYKVILYDPAHHEDFFNYDSYLAMVQNPEDPVTKAFFDFQTLRDVNLTKYGSSVDSILEHDYFFNEAVKSEINGFPQNVQEKYYKLALRALPNSPKAFFSLYNLFLKKYGYITAPINESDCPKELVNLTTIGFLYGHLKESDFQKTRKNQHT